jgi:hypothetical protein
LVPVFETSDFLNEIGRFISIFVKQKKTKTKNLSNELKEE